MIRLRWIILAVLIVSLSVPSCFAAETPKYSIGMVIAERHGGGNPFHSYYAVLNVEYKMVEPYGMEAWVYNLLRVHPYPSGSDWYTLEGEAPTERWQDQMQHDAGYSFFNTGYSINVNSIPREDFIQQFTGGKYQSLDIIQTNAGTYLIITGYEISNDGDNAVYYSCEIRKKADGSWGYVLADKYRVLNQWIYQREFEASVTQLVTHLPNDDGIEGADTFPTVVPVTTTRIPVTTARPIQIDTPTGPSTLPPTPIRTEGPSSNPFYPVNTPTPIPVATLPYVIQTVAPVSVEPVLVSPVAISPTVQPKVGFGKRYAVGNPGSFLGTRFGSGSTTTVTRGSRTGTTSDTVLKPGSRSYGITPPASGSFVRWYPAARWAAGIK